MIRSKSRATSLGGFSSIGEFIATLDPPDRGTITLEQTGTLTAQLDPRGDPSGMLERLTVAARA